MSKARALPATVTLVTALAMAACAESPGNDVTLSDGAAATALNAAGAIERLGDTRWAPKTASGVSAPSFVVDASWPKPLPNDWRIGQVGGIAVDSHDNIWVYHRPRTLDASSAGAMPRVATNDRGVPISALGHPRPYAERSTGCCVPAPSVLKFDREGNLLAAWGGPSDPGFLDESCREADGCFWPAREHGIFVDHDDFVYLAGNGEDGGARQQQGLATYPWAPSFGDDSHILKFTADGTFVYQIGTAGMEGPNSEKIDGGPNGTPQPYLVADMSVDAGNNRLYVADGYGNRRILIVDAATGGYVGHFGAYGQNPVLDDPSSDVADTDVGPWIADYQAGNLKPLFFRSPMHCATVSRDGLLYACDRGNNRVQIFDINAADLGKPCANPNAEVGKCGFVGEIHVAPQTASGTSGTAALSTDPGQTCLYVGDLGNNTLYILNRENRTELDRIGRAGRQAGEFHWLHAIAVDSRGDVYTGEVDTGQRIQKFARYGESSCSGTGSAEVGLYSNNR
jgi:DNA-binding beta-propeller fold protein YncE